MQISGQELSWGCRRRGPKMRINWVCQPKRKRKIYHETDEQMGEWLKVNSEWQMGVGPVGELRP